MNTHTLNTAAGDTALLAAPSENAANESSTAEITFRVLPIPIEFQERVRRDGRDDFGRPTMTTIAEGGEPLRDRLRRAVAGEPIILCAYAAVPVTSGFAEIGPVYVTASHNEADTREWLNELPAGYLVMRFALQAFSAKDEIVKSVLVEPEAATERIQSWLDDQAIAYLHARFGGNACFAARIERAHVA